MTTKTARKANPHIGSDFDEFLREESIYDQAQAVAVKRVLAHELERYMQRARLTKTDMARRMGTTRAQLDRLLNLAAQRQRLELLSFGLAQHQLRLGSSAHQASPCARATRLIPMASNSAMNF